MSTDYWPWWLGGASLAGVALLFPHLTGVPLGVSGILERLLMDSRNGPTPPSQSSAADCSGPIPPSISSTKPSPHTHSPQLDRSARLIFVLSVMAGGALEVWTHHKPWGQTQMSPEFHRLFGHGASALLVLFLGGILVGFGTRWSGGCTSGHGLSGCGRLQPPSLVATGVFFAVAIGVSFLLERILS